MLKLDPSSEAELKGISDEGLTRAVERVCDDPSGQREPRHRYTRKFRNPSKYVDARGRDVWEFKPPNWRGLFLIATKGDEPAAVFFLPVRGRRFMTLGECPWHKGK